MNASPVPRLGRSARLHLYTELQTMTTAGIPIITAINQLAGRSPGTRQGKLLEDFGEQLKIGTPLGEAAEQVGLADSFELALLRVAESTGDLHPLFQHMIDRIERERALTRGIGIGLIYPILLIHVAILLVPLHNLFSKEGGVGAYLLQSVVPLSILYALGILIYVLRRPLGGLFDSVVQSLPVIGKIRRHGDLARFFSSLDPLYAAGIPIIEAIRQAGATCVSPGNRAAIDRMADELIQGTPLAEAMGSVPLFPASCLSMVETAEQSGDMQPTFKLLYKQYEGNLKQSLKIVSIVVPILAFLGVAAYIGWLVVSFWLDYYDKILTP